MSAIHNIMQGKGGVGKSMVASVLTQYLKQEGIKTSAYDTDPVNRTFAGYKALSARVIDIMQGDVIDQRGFDVLMEYLSPLGEDEHAVVDNGAASFVPLGSYLADNFSFDLLREVGHEVYLHTVVTGGQAMEDCIDGLGTLIRSFPDTPVVVWLNRFFGEIISSDGRPFEEFKSVIELQSSIHSIIHIPLRKAETFGKDLADLFRRRRTFAEAAADPDTPLMVRQRYAIWWREMRQELDKARLLDG